MVDDKSADATDPPAELTGHVKISPHGNAVAIRTAFDKTVLPNMVWLVASTDLGSKNVSADYVTGWADIHVPVVDTTSDAN